MSALANLTAPEGDGPILAAPPPEPKTAGPYPSVRAPEPSGRRRWLVFLLLVTVAAGSYLLRPRREARTAAVLIRTAKAFRGALLSTVRLNGSVEARHFVNILAPVVQAPDSGRGMVLTYLSPGGSVVQEGQMVAQIDAQSVRDHLDDVDANVAQLDLEMSRLKAQQDAETEAIAQRVRVAKGNLEKAQQDVRAAPAKNRIDQEILKLLVEEMQAWYDEARRQIPLTVERQEAATAIQQINREYQVRHRNRHRADVDSFSIRAAMAGLVVIKPIYRNGEQGQTKAGDEVSPGQLIVRVVDLSEMELQTNINQTESELVRIGQSATVRFDAYPDLVLKGRVTAVGNFAAGGRRVNFFIRRIPVRIAIEGTDPRVIPDSSASADVVVGQQSDGVIVPREAIVEEDGKPVVYVKRDGAFAARGVEIGGYSNTGAAVISGLEAGEEVALERPASERPY